MPPSPPRATYRVQLRPGFGFDDAAAVVGYLSRLGVSHIYCSPILQAAPGSTHGYDVVDHGRLSEELGGAEAFSRLNAELRRHGMGMVVDVVPNHMAAAGRANAWWWDVLENGPSSQYAAYFDIDWDPPEAKLRQRVLVPVLGDHYGRVLEGGELRLRRRGGSFLVAYHDHEVPVSPRTIDELLAEAAAVADSDELASLADAFGRLPLASATDRDSVNERHRDKEVLRGRLGDVLEADPSLAAAVDGAVADLNADPDRFDVLLQRQNYRLAYWRVAGQELDYRRFFDIPDLIGLRTEDPAVFEDTHALILGLVAEGVVDGLRIDHPDGLRDPEGYLHRLARAASGAWIVIEKILEPHEQLRPDWPVAGTTGYDFLDTVGGLYVDPAGEGPLTELYQEVTGDEEPFVAAARRAKFEVMGSTLAADVERLTAAFVEVCEERRRYRDFTRVQLRQALREALASFDIYRTYVVPGTRPHPDDERAVGEALDRVREARPDIEDDLIAILGHILLGNHPAGPDAELAYRFQQTSSPVMAKGVEDTAFYRYVRLVSANEVGGDPSRFAVPPEELHRRNRRRAADWPASMLASSTHDTKRSEDVRARIVLLSEIPGPWADAVARWRDTNRRHRTSDLPDARTEYLLYQTLVGAHPLSVDRALAYMEKATREAKLMTSWTDPDEEFEQALRSFVESALADPAFTDDLDAFVAPLVGPGRVNSLSALLLKLTCPGVPDIYQGTEAWDLSLVDPDNRRPVDHGRLGRLLDEVADMTGAEAWERADDGVPKLLTVARALDLRARRPAAFGPGSAYTPLAVDGSRAGHAVAYLRSPSDPEAPGGRVAVVVPRLVIGLGGRWEDTTVELPPGEWDDVLGGKRWSATTEVGQLLSGFPVALLEEAGG